MLKAIREIQPRWVVAENVYGFINWSRGLVFEQVQTDLENEGYEVWPVILPACGKNAPHKRDRVWIVAYSNIKRQPNRNTSKRKIQSIKKRIQDNREINRFCSEQFTSNSDSRRQSRKEYRQKESGLTSEKSSTNEWQNFPTQPPIRMRDDGISNKLLIFVVKELYDEISKTSKENRIENLPEVWERVSQEEVWEKIRGLYSMESKDILFKTMQLYSGGYYRQDKLSPFSQEVSKPIMQHLQKHGEFRRSPQGRQLEKQRFEQFGDSLSFLPHEVALAARRFETSIAKFEAWHRNESIKAYGNAIVPQIAYELFKAIQDYYKQKKSLQG